MGPLPGVAGLADRPVDQVRVARVMAAVALVLAALAAGLVERLLATADLEPDGGPMLRALLSAPRPPRTPPARVAVVLVDGLRVDEARALPSWRALAATAQTGALALETPTLSRPFQHVAFTGVPSHASGVRSNRFVARARHASVMDEVRDAGGQVFIVGEGLDWIRRMHGRPQDGGSDAEDALGAPLDEALAAFSAAAPPALLVVHPVSVDGTAHAGGVHSDAHRDALARADEVIARVAAAGTALFVLSDHGHRDAGGHGGPEPEVARAPILARAPGVGAFSDAVSPNRVAPTLARALGVAEPRHGSEPAVGEAAGPDHERASSLVEAGRRASRMRLSVRRRWTALLAVVWLVMTLGPIKRAFGFDRSVPAALALWPGVVMALHLTLGRPLSLSAIDGRLPHALRVLALGATAALIVVALGFALGTGPRGLRLRRAAACVGWSAAASALAAGAYVGFALGPWPLGPLERYLPLLIAGAAGGGLAVVAAALLAGGRADPAPAPSPVE